MLCGKRSPHRPGIACSLGSGDKGGSVASFHARSCRWCCAVRPLPGLRPCGESSVLVAAQPVPLASLLVREARVRGCQSSKNHLSQQGVGQRWCPGPGLSSLRPSSAQTQGLLLPRLPAVPGGVELPSRDSVPVAPAPWRHGCSREGGGSVLALLLRSCLGKPATRPTWVRPWRPARVLSLAFPHRSK